VSRRRGMSAARARCLPMMSRIDCRRSPDRTCQPPKCFHLIGRGLRLNNRLPAGGCGQFASLSPSRSLDCERRFLLSELCH
jgi:hypothetical protein